MEMLGENSQKVVRIKEDSYKKLNFPLSDNDLVAEQLNQDPTLIQRPIFVHKGQAVVARPPEEVLTLL